MNKLAVATLLALSAPALAQSTHMDMPEGSKEIQLALAAGNGPRSEGSAQRTNFVAPLFSVQWANGFFIRMNEFGVHLSEHPNLQYGVIAVPTFSRATTLPGDGEPSKRRFTPEVGGFLNYHLAHGVNLNAGLLYGGSIDHRGLRMRIGAQFWMPVSAHHSLGVVTSVVMANRSALHANFAVAPEQARAALPVHEVSGGLHNSTIGGRWRWELAHKYTLMSSVDWRRLHGSAAASPRVQQAGALTVSTMVIYSF